MEQLKPKETKATPHLGGSCHPVGDRNTHQEGATAKGSNAQKQTVSNQNRKKKRKGNAAKERRKQQVLPQNKQQGAIELERVGGGGS